MIVWGDDGNSTFQHRREIQSQHGQLDGHQHDQRTHSRAGHTAVLTGSEMIVWGGADENNVPFNTGGRYDPITDSWTATSTTGAPNARTFTRQCGLAVK